MGKSEASRRAYDMVMKYIESQPNDIHWTQGDHASTGKAMAEMFIEMHKTLAAHFETSE